MGRLTGRLRVVFLVTVLVVAAFSTGIPFLFFLVYLVTALVLGSYLYTRHALRGIAARYEVMNPQAEVGEVLRASYRVENRSGWSKPWLEISNPSNLPAALPGRAIGMGAHSSRQWIAKVPLVRRGTFRLGALHLRAGDPFGFFTRESVIGQATSIVVFPKVVQLPFLRLPSSTVDGKIAARRRSDAASPLVTGIRPYQHGDALNRVHWLSSARHQELQVKEFEMEHAADLWILLDLDRTAHAGVGLEASSELAISAAASIALRTLSDNRAVGVLTSGRRTQVLAPDRGERMVQKVMHLLANVEADGGTPVSEAVIGVLPRLRRGMTLAIITGSTRRDWVRPLAELRRRGAASMVVLLDRAAFAGRGGPESEAETSAVRHALAEYGVVQYVVRPHDDLAEVLHTSVAARV